MWARYHARDIPADRRLESNTKSASRALEHNSSGSGISGVPAAHPWPPAPAPPSRVLRASPPLISRGRTPGPGQGGPPACVEGGFAAKGGPGAPRLATSDRRGLKADGGRAPEAPRSGSQADPPRPGPRLGSRQPRPCPAAAGRMEKSPDEIGGGRAAGHGAPCPPPTLDAKSLCSVQGSMRERKRV